MSRNRDTQPARLRAATPEARARERTDKSNLCKINITVRKATAYHLRTMAKYSGHGDMGRIVDKLVRAHQLGQYCGEVTPQYGEDDL